MKRYILEETLTSRQFSSLKTQTLCFCFLFQFVLLFLAHSGYQSSDMGCGGFAVPFLLWFFNRLLSWAISAEMSLLLAFEAASFLHQLRSFLDGESVHIHRIRISFFLWEYKSFLTSRSSIPLLPSSSSS